MKSIGSWSAAVMLVVFFGHFFFTRFQIASVDYWILKDGAEATARITDDHSEAADGDVTYSFTVNGQQYTGTEKPDWEKPFPKTGDKCTVYYSASHPWLSLLKKPKTFVDRCAIAVLLLFSFVITAISMLVAAAVRRFRRRHYPPLPNARRGPPPLPDSRRS